MVAVVELQGGVEVPCDVLLERGRNSAAPDVLSKLSAKASIGEWQRSLVVGRPLLLRGPCTH